jgi:aspartate/methionine/tyrosine aminotransferase
VGDIYERGVTINAVSKGFGLPGLRVGWVACQDRRLLAEVQLAKSMLSSCHAAPSEVLAHVALRAEARIVERNRAVLDSNRRLLELFLGQHLEAFEGRRPPTRRLSSTLPGFRWCRPVCGRARPRSWRSVASLGFW